MSRLSLPLFPLHTVLFPGGALPLRVFEARYLDMVTDCMKHERGFGVCLIREGSEVGDAASTYDVGTLVSISYFEHRPDGLLGITVNGEQRFRILEQSVRSNQLIHAEVELLPAESACPVPEHCQELAGLLQQILEELAYPYAKLPRHYDDAGWVGARLTELLPLKLEFKQYLLQMDDPRERLERLRAMLESGNYS